MVPSLCWSLRQQALRRASERVCIHAGVEFRVTEEYDEDSPFSRPPDWKPLRPKQDPTAAPDSAPADSTSQDSNEQSSLAEPRFSHQVSAEADGAGNGLQPASETHAPTDRVQSEPSPESQRTHDAEEQLQSSALSGSTDLQTAPSVGRGQVHSKETDTPEVLPAGIELSSQSDSERPGSTQVMDTVHQKPGIRRTLDSSGHVAPDRDHEQQGPLPPPRPQTAPKEPQGDPSKAEGPDQGRPWWEAAVSSVSEAVYGAAEAIKGAVAAGLQSVSKGQSDSQQSGACTWPLLASGCCCCCSVLFHINAQVSTDNSRL